MKNNFEKFPSSPQKAENYKNILREIPVSINNFHGDPTLQWQDTSDKLEQLSQDQHTGPVGLITKGKMTAEKVKTLTKYQNKGLKLVVLNSISELPQFEKVGMEHRYENIFLLNKAGIPNIAYIRPMIPPHNTDPKTIKNMFSKLNKVGAKHVVASGFRGDDNIVKDMSPDQKQEWVLRVKIMTKDVYELMKDQAKKYNMHLFTRTSCGVSATLGQKTTYNPYKYSPNLVHCQELECPIEQTCQPSRQPKDHSIDLVKDLGYDIDFQKGNCKNECHTTGENRLNCPSCCTTCYLLDVPRIEVKNENIKLGDLTFIRFITGLLTSKKDVNDDGALDIGHINLPKFPEIKNIQALNSWWPFARNHDKCFDCAYCIEKYYKSNRKDYGFSPAQLVDKISALKK